MYSKQEVYISTLQYFNGDELATNKWIEKYCLKNKAGELLELRPSFMHSRMATEFARIESKYPNPLTQKQIYETFENFKYIIPQGSPMYGIGNNFSITSLSNCFVIGSNNDSDSYGSIMRADEEQVQLMKRRGGVGQDISHLRPSGAFANNAVLGGMAGMTLFMERYSNSTREVAQDGRRGALMLSVSIKHPDADKFIDIKLQQGKVTGANISVKITDEFMKAVEKDEDFWQTFPVDMKISIGEYYDNILLNLEFNKLTTINNVYNSNDEKVEVGYIKRIKARELWNKIVQNAWQSAEPGILFWDKIISESPADSYGGEWETKSTNPCFTGDTIVAVADGRNGVSIKELTEKGENFIVFSARKNKSTGNHGKGWKPEIKPATAFKTGYKKVIEIVLSDGSSFKCTPDHLLATDDGTYIEAKDSTGFKLSKFYSFSNKNSGQHYRNINSKSNGSSKQYRMIWEYYNGNYDGNLFNIDHIDTDSTNDSLLNLRILSLDEHKKVTKRFGSDNPVQKISGTELHRLNNKRKNILANSSKYNWGEKRKQEALNNFDELYGNIIKSLQPEDLNVYFDEPIYVNSIIELGFEDVYDLNVEDNHNFYIITNSDDERYLNCSGVLVHNCGEIPLNPYDSCRLLALNLYSYVNFPFQPNASFDFKLFKYHVYIAQRLMDDIVDLEIEKIDAIINKIISDPEPEELKQVELNVWKKIKQKAVEGRRTGLGVTAEGDMLAAMGLQYGSEEATNLAIEVHKTLAIESYKTSIDLAKERGAFPIWDYEKEKNNPFIYRVFEELSGEYRLKLITYGRRNISNLTIAPTGTTSLMSQTTSGVEPLFRPFYKRRTKTEDLSKVKFVDEIGDKWEEYFVIHPKFKTWYDSSLYKTDPKLFDLDFHKEIEDYNEEDLNRLFEKSPYYKATANDIDWVSSVKMQGMIQKWIDHSISKTVNIPKETTVETVSDIYITAWKEGCKGVTIYRDGSRSGVLVDSKENKNNEEFTYTDSHKRPKVTQCDIYHKTALKQNWTVLVGKVDNKPYEIFVIKEVSDKIFPIEIKHGTLTKVKSRTYKLEGIHHNKSYSIENIIPLMTDNEAVNTRKYSAMLRHRIDPKFICREIDEYATIVSFDKVVQRVLRNYVIEKEEDRIKCPVCNSTNYYSEEGCWKCPDCNFSKCG